MPHPESEHGLRVQLATALRDLAGTQEAWRALRVDYLREKARADAAEKDRGYEVKWHEETREALAAARRDLPVGLEWQAILDALLFVERECGGFVSDAHLRVKPKVEALGAPAAAADKKASVEAHIEADFERLRDVPTMPPDFEDRE